MVAIRLFVITIWLSSCVCNRRWDQSRIIKEVEGSSANVFGSESDLTIEYSASSKWSGSYDAGHAVEGEGAYWCSDGGDEAPLYWWISFKEKPMEIVTITFEEEYPGAVFEFFGSSTEECAEKGTVLISGNRADIYNRKFTNGRAYHCYGLKITKLAKSSYGRLASLMKFDFQYTENKATCYLHKNEGWEYRGDKNVTISGKTCQEWTSQVPHAHKFTPKSFPNWSYYKFGRNRCRNPKWHNDWKGWEKWDDWQNKPDGPWCYTTDKKKEWEYCFEKCEGVGECPPTTDDLWYNYVRAHGWSCYKGYVVSCTSDHWSKHLDAKKRGTCQSSSFAEAKEETHHLFHHWMPKNPGENSVYCYSHEDCVKHMIFLDRNEPGDFIPCTRKRGSYQLGTASKMKYGASSYWFHGVAYNHKPYQAVKGPGYYWSSKYVTKVYYKPQYWWISFEEEQVEIVAIKFKRKYNGYYQFFASVKKEKCFSKDVADDDLRFFIKGYPKKMSLQYFENGQKYHCYGLKITNFAKYATVEDFKFYVPSEPSDHQYCRYGFFYTCRKTKDGNKKECYANADVRWDGDHRPILLKDGSSSKSVPCKEHSDCDLLKFDRKSIVFPVIKETPSRWG